MFPLPISPFLMNLPRIFFTLQRANPLYPVDQELTCKLGEENVRTVNIFYSN